MPINTPPQKPTTRATIHDVALEAGVSIKTVSRVVNGERHVRPSVEARVFEVIARLGYQPNEVARSLKGSRSRTIGLIIADISNPFYATCAKAVEEVARSHGFAVILCTSNENVENEEAYIDLLSRRRVDGLLLVPTAEDHDHLRRMRSYGLPVVALDRPVEETATDSVVAQNQVGVRLAIEHLIGHGHKRIAFVGADEHLYTVRTRLAGYHEAIRAAGLEEICRFGAPNTESAAEVTEELLRLPEPPTAIFAVNNLITVGVLAAIDRAQLRIPQDIAFAGFDDIELASVLRPRLTLVRQPAAELGRQAATLLFDRLRGEQKHEPRHIMLETQLIIRESCGCPGG